MKPFTWSWSKLKNWRSCPKRHWEIDIAKRYKEDESDQLLWGHQVHEAMAKRIGQGKPLPPTMAHYDGWAKRAEKLRPEMTIMVEQKLAMARDFSKTGYFDDNTWFRAVADVLAISKPAKLAITYDWKTGGSIKPDMEQLALSAQVIFAHYPEIDTVGTSFIWLGHDDETARTYQRDEMLPFWNGMWPEIKKLEFAHQTTDYPAKPSGLCIKYCPVKSCVFHGKGSPR
jgi:PD-(D/E)XK nuclease superfamily